MRNPVSGILLIVFLAMHVHCKKEQLPITSFPIAGVPFYFIEHQPIDSFIYKIPAPYPVSLGYFFEFSDSLLQHLNDTLNYPLNLHLLVHANPWIMDSLAATDYYLQMEKGNFVYDNRKIPILQAGDTIRIPSLSYTMVLAERLRSFRLDVNIPEFRLRILQDIDTLYSFPVRVGRNEQKYLKMAGHTVDLRTVQGKGRVVRIEDDPVYINPCDCKPYEETTRDDGRRTRCPRIPWIEPEISGIRSGHLIHPTTNPKTLGKAYSNGCVGTSESAAWRIYFHAPLGTPVTYRYDLTLISEQGDTVRLRDVYGLE